DEAERGNEQAIAAAQLRAARERRAELDAAIGSSAPANLQPLFPAERDRVVRIHAAGRRQIRFAPGSVGDRHALEDGQHQYKTGGIRTENTAAPAGAR